MSSDIEVPASLRKRVDARWAPLMGKLGVEPGRNEGCWCGSGKRYKRCHADEDARFRAGLDLPHGIGPGVHAIAGDVLAETWEREGRTVQERRQIADVVARATMLAWNIVRMPPTDELLGSLAKVAAALPGGLSVAFVDLVARLAHRARWVQAHDRRLVREVQVEVGEDGFSFRVEAAMPG